MKGLNELTLKGRMKENGVQYDVLIGAIDCGKKRSVRIELRRDCSSLNKEGIEAHITVNDLHLYNTDPKSILEQHAKKVCAWLWCQSYTEQDKKDLKNLLKSMCSWEDTIFRDEGVPNE